MTSEEPARRPDEPWWKRAVVYQVYPRSFADSDGDGIGDLRGLISKLDYLARLGVDVVWVSPFYRSPMHDNGYDVADHQDVDPMFGTLADVDELVAGLHARGMKLVLDVVLNHTSDEHPWFVESRSRIDSAKRDWYWWRPPRPGVEPGTLGAEPTNWSSFFTGPTWTLDPRTGEYYLHLFAPQQPDLNWENPEVRRALHAMLRWWVGRGVDGFRMDVVNMVSKRLPLVDGAVVPGRPYGDGSPSYICGPRIHEYLRELRREVSEGFDKVLLMIGETPAVTTADALQFTDPGNGELDMVFQFEHVGLDSGPGGKFDVRPLRLVELKASMERWQEALEATGWNSLYWGNHDQPRAVSRFGCDDPAHRELSAKTLATVLHLHRGTPYVYQGDELGMTNFPFESLDQLRDVESLGYARYALDWGADERAVVAAVRAKGRDNARTPMQWDAGPNAGFTTGTPWLPVNPNHVEVNAAGQVDVATSVFGHHRRLIALRHELDVVVDGDFTMLLPAHEQVYAFTRRLGDDELLVLANMSCADAVAGVPRADAWAGAEVLVAADGGPTATVSGFALGPWESVVLRRHGGTRV